MFNDYIGELREDEYEVDGVYYCKKCKTPRMFVSPDGKFRARAICVCQAERKEREKAEAEEMERLRPMQELSCVSLIGQRYKEATFSKTKLGDTPTFETAFYRCKKYCDNADRVLKKWAWVVYLRNEWNRQNALGKLYRKRIGETEQASRVDEFLGNRINS